ncbi:aerobic glycerol-3-phosphate dehydrogenase [hydrocarbon metagenome]|uniref:Aerobic glycerol-3-phosphate dehydrogenase n=1 Tax=hydrocarbon metagenome TaxID=938273 RepID=A0A0W8E1U7_9ZZZZ
MRENFDCIVMGAGINGCAVAKLLSEQGKKVAVLERKTIGCGTSSNSSKLIHGGLRYLESGQFGLVKKSLKDRSRLCELYPDLIKLVPFYLPIYYDSPRPWWMIRVGLGFYDIFADQQAYAAHPVNIAEFSERFMDIKTAGLKKVYMYYDGKTDDLLLTRRIAADAEIGACTIKENCEIDEIIFYDKQVLIFCRDDQGEYEFAAKHLINASGPWIDEVNERYKLPHNYHIARVSGIHIVIDKVLVPDCMFLQTADKRIFFMIPWKDKQTIIGTTERMETGGCDDVRINNEDIDYLIRCADHYLREEISEKDICGTFLGIRPLIMKKQGADPNRMSRDYKIDVLVKGGVKLIHIYGGKLTTCLSTAEDVVEVL